MNKHKHDSTCTFESICSEDLKARDEKIREEAIKQYKENI